MEYYKKHLISLWNWFARHLPPITSLNAGLAVAFGLIFWGFMWHWLGPSIMFMLACAAGLIAYASARASDDDNED